jgi:hypothetical protein
VTKNFVIFWLDENSINWKENLVASRARGLILINLNWGGGGGLHEKHAVATWVLGTISAVVRSRGETKNFISICKNSVATSMKRHCLYQKDQPVNAVQGNCARLFQKSHKTLCMGKMQFLNVKASCTYRYI